MRNYIIFLALIFGSCKSDLRSGLYYSRGAQLVLNHDSTFDYKTNGHFSRRAEGTYSISGKRVILKSTRNPINQHIECHVFQDSNLKEIRIFVANECCENCDGIYTQRNLILNDTMIFLIGPTSEVRLGKNINIKKLQVAYSLDSIALPVKRDSYKVFTTPLSLNLGENDNTLFIRTEFNNSIIDYEVVNDTLDIFRGKIVGRVLKGQSIGFYSLKDR